MDRMMEYREVKLAMRIIGLRGTNMKARRNAWRRKSAKDFETIWSLSSKGHAKLHMDEVTPTNEYWYLTNQGIQQLKQQIGEFHF